MFGIKNTKTRINTFLIIATLLNALSYSMFIEEDKIFTVKKSSDPIVFTSNFLEEDVSNEFKVKFQNGNILNEENLYIILESENTDFYLNIWTFNERSKNSETLKVGTYSGNSLFILGKGLYDNKLEYVRNRNHLYFGVKATSNQKNKNKTKFTLKVFTAKKLLLDMGKIYTTMIDSSVKMFDIDYTYDGSKEKDLQKLRFQLTAIRTIPGWQLGSTLSYGSQTFQMNPIFKKAVGGVLTQPDLPVCHEKNCLYSMGVRVTNVHMFNIETFKIGKIEQLSISHYEDYYDRVYQSNEMVVYELPYNEDMNGLDISVSLIPVTGDTDLYINPNNIPKNLNSYAFSEKGHLAKRITIQWKELQEMKADKTSLYIGVQCNKPGEFLVKIDAHDNGFRGTLAPGIIESGMVQFEEIANYIYMFEVIQTQDITFDIKLSINSGNADLYLFQCGDYEDCAVTNDTIASNTGILKMENNLNEKDIKHKFTCEHSGSTSASVCQFAIGVKGKENHGTHYELSLREEEFHRLVLPGHSISLEIEPEEITYVKFSFPSKSSENSKLFLSIEAVWGSFDAYLSKQEEFPNEEKYDIKETFDESSGSALSSLRTVDLDASKFADNRLEGIYYLGLKAKTESSFIVKFFEKSEHDISIHTLTAGKQVRGSLTHISDILYYSIRVSLDDVKASSVVVNLSPLKGNFIMFANRNGILPTKNHNEFFSENNHLELKISEGKKETEEFFIGISSFDLKNNSQNNEDNLLPEEIQFNLSFSYSNKPIRLKPGIISSHIIQPNNIFLIKVLDSFNDLLILKSLVDGYNIQMCAEFTTTENDETVSFNDSCEFSANEKAVSLYIKKEQLDSECQNVKSKSTNHKPDCYIKIKLNGYDNQSIRIGYTYNNKPFHLVKGQILNGPGILDSNAQVNFIYHPEKNKELGFYFNSKGSSISLYSKLVNGDSFDESLVSQFPSADDHDEEQIRRIGYVENIYYSQKEIEAIGNNPEVLLSVRPSESITSQNKDIVFDSKNYFILQTALDCIEIMRTQSISQFFYQDEWNYFSFYNNGNTDHLKVYIISEVAVPIEAMIATGLSSRPPLTNKPLITKTGLGSIEIEINPIDLKQQAHDENPDLKGYYVLAVKASSKANINIYWNNKDDLNYLELTPNEPSTMTVNNTQKMYFAFYARDVNSNTSSSPSKERKEIRVYTKVNVKATIYLLKSPSGELNAPSASNYNWKTTTAEKGGVAMIDIKPEDQDYCVDCLYIGYVEVSTPGQVSVLANIKHDNIPVHLKPGFTFPEYMDTHEKLYFRVINPDSGNMNLIFSMLSGQTNVYVSRSKDISESKYDELYSTQTSLHSHLLVQLSPSKYNLSGSNEWFIMLDNPKQDPASMTITLEKNSIKSPIEPGITKYTHLAEREDTVYYYKPSSSEKQFELRLELDQVMDSKLIDKALENLEQFIFLFEITSNSKTLDLKPKEVHKTYNKLYIKFELDYKNSSTFGIKLKNAVGCPVALRVDLLNGFYKLVNFNTYNFGILNNNKKMVYEVYGARDKYVFVDVRKCFGEPKVSFYQTDYQKLSEDDAMKYKTIKDENSFVQYVKLEH